MWRIKLIVKYIINDKYNYVKTLLTPVQLNVFWESNCQCFKYDCRFIWKPKSCHQSCLWIPLNLICTNRVDCEIMWLHRKLWLNSVCILMHLTPIFGWWEKRRKGKHRRWRALDSNQRQIFLQRQVYILENWNGLTFSKYLIRRVWKRVNTFSGA